MNWRAAALLPVMLAVGACEGGSRGSGISTSVIGNVQSVQPAAASAPQGAPSDLAGIRVVVEGKSARGRTDADGNFAVHGGFEGQIVLVFRLPDGGGEARTDVNVPAAGTLTLNNVRVDAAGGDAAAETEEVEFDAIITGIDCAGLTLTLASSRRTAHDVDQYTLRLDTSSVLDAHGNPVPCSALQVGEHGFVRGTVNPDGSFGNATVDLEN